MSIAIGGGNSRVFRGLKLMKVVRMVRLLRLFRIFKVVRLQVLAEEFMEVRLLIARASITQPRFPPNNMRRPLRCYDVVMVDRRHTTSRDLSRCGDTTYRLLPYTNSPTKHAGVFDETRYRLHQPSFTRFFSAE